MKKIEIAIAGVGNCVCSLIQIDFVPCRLRSGCLTEISEAKP
jgi:hypothetical protein